MTGVRGGHQAVRRDEGWIPPDAGAGAVLAFGHARQVRSAPRQGQRQHLLPEGQQRPRRQERDNQAARREEMDALDKLSNAGGGSGYGPDPHEN